MDLAFFLNPIDLRRDVRQAHERHFARHLKPGMKVFDIGCGSKPFAGTVEEKTGHYAGVDVADGFYDQEHIDLVGSAYAIPVADGEADALISCQVIEHLEEPEKALAECRRALRDEGFLFLSFPFLYPQHAVPRDYFRYTEYIIAPLLARHGFRILEQERLGGFWYDAGVCAGVYLQSFNRGPLKRFHVVRALTCLVKWFFLALHGAEGLLLDALEKDKASLRQVWTANYVIVAQKSPRAAALPSG